VCLGGEECLAGDSVFNERGALKERREIGGERKREDWRRESGKGLA